MHAMHICQAMVSVIALQSPWPMAVAAPLQHPLSAAVHVLCIVCIVSFIRTSVRIRVSMVSVRASKVNKVSISIGFIVIPVGQN